MSTSLRALALAALIVSPGCIGPIGDDYLDNWNTSWKYKEEKISGPGGKLRNGRLAVTGKDDFSASFAWIPLELGDGARVHATYRFEKPDRITGNALTGLQIQPLGPEAPVFFLIQSVLQAQQLVLNVFAQAGPNLVFQKVITGQEHVDLELRLDATAFHFYVDGVKEAETPIPNPTIDWVVGLGFSGLGVGERVSLERAMVKGGAGKPGHTPEQQVKRSIFAAGEPLQAIVDANDGQAQSPADTLAALALAKAGLLAALDEADQKLTDAKLKDDVRDDLFDALGKVNKLLKKVQKKADQGKSLKTHKLRNATTKALKEVAGAGLRLATPPMQMP